MPKKKSYDLTRDAARAYFKTNYMEYTKDDSVFIAYPIHKEDVMYLYQLCKRELSKIADYRPDIIMSMSRCPVIKCNRNGAIKEAYLYCDSDYFNKREAISFNRDGWIGFAGWASDTNVKPFLQAFYEWIDWFVDKYGEVAQTS